MITTKTPIFAQIGVDILSTWRLRPGIIDCKDPEVLAACGKRLGLGDPRPLGRAGEVLAPLDAVVDADAQVVQRRRS